MVRVLAGTERGYRGDTCRFTYAVAYMYYIFTCVWHIYWGHLPGHLGYFFQVFRTSLGHVLHFFTLVTYLFKTFTHQIISVHPEDPPEISYFSQDNYLDTRLFFFWVFRKFLGYVLHFYMCVTYLFKTVTTKLLVYIPKMLRKFCTFPGTITRTPGCFFSGFLHIPRTCRCVENLNKTTQVFG